jgi:hypothetical protein
MSWPISPFILGQVNPQDTMTSEGGAKGEAPMPLTPSMFEAQEGGTLGKYQICDRQDKVGKHCRWCCEGRQIPLGVCRHCVEQGPTGSICFACGTKFEKEMVLGHALFAMDKVSEVLYARIATLNAGFMSREKQWIKIDGFMAGP